MTIFAICLAFVCLVFMVWAVMSSSASTDDIARPLFADYNTSAGEPTSVVEEPGEATSEVRESNRVTIKSGEHAKRETVLEKAKGVSSMPDEEGDDLLNGKTLVDEAEVENERIKNRLKVVAGVGSDPVMPTYEAEDESRRIDLDDPKSSAIEPSDEEAMTPEELDDRLSLE